MKNLAKKDEFDICYIHFPQGYTGEKFIARADRKFNAELFSKKELEVLNDVALKFKDMSTPDIVDYSHLEEAWKNNMEEKKIIGYNHAFELNPL